MREPDGASPATLVPAVAAPPATTTTDPRSVTNRGLWPPGAVTAVVTAVITVLIGLLALLPLRTPQPAGAGATATDFAAGRALDHIAAIAQAPRPTGSPASDRAREHLMRTLTSLGLDPAVSVRQTCRADAGETVCGQVSNVSATVPGSRRDGTVVLVAHYDSVIGGPGASDNGLGVATLLEVARALVAGPELRNDVLLLFTDGEEAGLLGARAAVESAALPAPDRSVVLNLESRGPSGPVVMFETGERNGAIVAALRGHPPMATSAAQAVFRLLPNDTDLTEFRRAGYTGMNFAVVAGSNRYDNTLDDIDSVDRRSLQDMGDTTLSAVRELGSARLATAAHSGRVTYFPVFVWLAAYPHWLPLPLALLAASAFGAALWFGRRRVGVRVGRVALAAGTLLAAAFLGGAAGLLGWRLLVLARPDYVGFILGDPYRPGLRYAGFAVVAVAVAVAWLALLRRRVTSLEVNAAVTGLFAMTALGLAAALPDAAYLTTWPALAGAAALAITGRRADGSPWRSLAWALPAAATTVLLAPVAAMLFPTLGLATVAVPMVVVVLVAAALLAAPTLPRPGRRTAAACAALVLCGGALVAVGTARDRVDARHPRQVSLVYAVDADSGAATWLSPYPVANPFIDHYVGAERRSRESDFPLLLASSYRSGTAKVVGVPAPVVSLVAAEQDGPNRRLRLRLAADSPAATMLALYVDTSASTVVGARVAGQPLPGGSNRPDATAWRWAFAYVGPLADGLEAELTVAGGSAVRLKVIVQSPGLPREAMDVPMPVAVTGAITPAVQTVSARTVTY
jgi:hypothetical protein